MAEDPARLDREREGRKLSNEDWVSKSDPDARIAKMKDGTTHLAYKPEHAVDLDTGAVVAAEANLETVDAAGGYGAIFVLIAPAGTVLVAQIVLIVSEDGETAFAAICIVVG